MIKKFKKSVIAVEVSLFLLSCGNNPAQREAYENVVEFTTYSVEKQVPFGIRLMTSSAQPKLTLKFDLPDITEEGPTRDFFRAQFYGGKSPEDYAQAKIEQYRKDYKEMEALVKQRPDLSYAVLNWEYSENFCAALFGTQYLELRRSREYFNGGAHPTQENSWFVIDIEKNTKLSLSSAFKPESLSLIKGEIEDALRMKVNIAPAAALSSGGYFEDDIVIPENFFFSPEGVTFYWNPVEIAPYASGTITVTLPYADLRDKLTRAGTGLSREAGGV
jgi:hypothetical protein